MQDKDENVEKLIGKIVTAQVKYHFGKPRKVCGELWHYSNGSGDRYGVHICGRKCVTICVNSIEEGKKVFNNE